MLILVARSLTLTESISVGDHSERKMKPLLPITLNFGGHRIEVDIKFFEKKALLSIALKDAQC